MVLKATLNLNSFLIILFLVLHNTILFSQNYEPGYVVLNSKDTIYGKVKDRDNMGVLNKIRFINFKGKTKRYAAKDILSYKRGIYTFESKWYSEESRFFKIQYFSKTGYGEKVFLKVIVKGALNCYAKEFMDDYNAYPDEFELFQRQGESILIRATQGVFGLKKKQLASYFSDCPNLVDNINNNALKTPVEVVDYYNTFCNAASLFKTSP